MKTMKFIMLFVFATSLFIACDKDEDVIPPAKPEVTLLGLGSGHDEPNDRMAKIGGDFHAEIDVVAEGKIDKIQVIVHPEGEDHDHEDEEEEDHEEWEIDTIFTQFSGLKNTLFHEHFDVPETAEPGEYHFDFIVTDMEGYQSSVESDLEIIE